MQVNGESERKEKHLGWERRPRNVVEANICTVQDPVVPNLVSIWTSVEDENRGHGHVCSVHDAHLVCGIVPHSHLHKQHILNEVHGGGCGAGLVVQNTGERIGGLTCR